MSSQHFGAPAYFRISGSIALESGTSELAHTVLSRPKQLALLAILACAPNRFVRRDALLPLLWSELDQERARAALRKTVFSIRRALGPEAVEGRGAEEIGLGHTIDCDVIRFRAHMAAGDVELALGVGMGELLPGFHLSGEPEFERWLDNERNRLDAQTRAALLAAFGSARRTHDAIGTARLVEMARQLHPNDEVLLRESMEALRDAGDLTGALRACERFRTRLERDLGATPSATTERLASEIRSTLNASAPPTPEPPALFAPRERQKHPAPAESVRSRGWRTALMAAAMVLVLVTPLTAVLFARSTKSQRHEAPSIAVAGIASFVAGDTASAAALADMLATSLARIPGLPVHSTLRLYEAAGGDASPASLSRAARRIGADQSLEGGLHPGTDGSVRLELRHIDLSSGTVIASYRIEAPTPVDAVNRATARIATAFGLPVPATSFESVSTQSLHAYTLYEQGLRAWYRADPDAARELFRKAVVEDSTFAMATWMLAKSLAWTPEWIPTYDRAVRLAERATERERLMIRASYLASMEHPARAAVADTLAARYPYEPAGHQLVAEALMAGGRPLDAIPHLQRVLELDTLGLIEVTPGCVACEALWHMGAAYFGADSARAGLETWHAWARAVPGSAIPWSWLAYAYESLERYDDAEDALLRMQRLDPTLEPYEIRLAGLRLHANRLADADSLLLRQRRAGDVDRSNLLWNLALLRINQGRFGEALEYADSFRLAGPAHDRLARGYMRGIVLLNAGRAREAVLLFDSIAARPNTYTVPSRLAREMVMNLTHVADAVAGLENHSRLRALEDSVREWGAMSGYERDRIMHHHVRALRHHAEGRLEESIDAFRSAQFGPRSAGYARTNLELARVLLEAGRPEEALHPLRLNLLSGIGAAQMWASRTEARELLAIAHDRIGNADSARVHYAAVQDSWRNADSVLTSRRAVLAAPALKPPVNPIRRAWPRPER